MIENKNDFILFFLTFCISFMYYHGKFHLFVFHRLMFYPNKGVNDILMNANILKQLSY